ncbi:MAG: DNA polymerase III subunit delta [Acidobacteria bacterium]|nr:DNA polymerase III subunit delta [Acidobacteriota bacterium]
MPTAAPDAIRHAIQSGTVGPLYVLAGEDEAEKNRLVAGFSSLVEEQLRAFNVERLYGGETTFQAVLDAAATLPFAADRRIVIVLQAEKLLEPKRESEATARALEDFEAYVRAPAPHTVLVLVAAELDGRRRMTKQLQQQAIVVDCGGLGDVGDAQRWIRREAESAGVEFDPAAVRLLAEFSGPDIVRLRADFERVRQFASGQKKVTVVDVQEVVTPASAPEDDWAIVKAIGRGATAEALRELAAALEAGAIPFGLLGQLGWLVRSRFPPQRAGEAVDALFRTDLDLKTSAGDPRVLLERLVIELSEAIKSSGRPGSAGRPWP